MALVGCAAIPDTDWRAGAADVRQCERQFRKIDKTVDKADVADAEYQRLEAFPYFRLDRFLASYDVRALTPAERTAWIDRLVARDQEARSLELRNLSAADYAHLAQKLNADPRDEVSRCASLMRAHDHQQKRAHKSLAFIAHAESRYSDVKKIAGLYPLSAPFVSRGFKRWKKKNLPYLTAPVETLPVSGTLRRFGPQAPPPLDAAAVAAIVESSRTNALHIPEPEGAAARTLIDRFAPVFEVDVVDDNDLPGRAVRRHGRSDVTVGSPAVYTRFSHTRVGNQVLLQITYLIWFRARPKHGSFDLLGGHLDGLIWRVTLAGDGSVYAYDTIHPCGCYHLFFPGASLTLAERAKPSLYREGITVAGTAPQPAPHQRVLIHLSSGSHYVRHVGLTAADAETTYAFSDYHSLRSLPVADGHESYFTENGLVAGTGRGERFTLWITGIKSPGAMRQWGHHATSFVGERHFDDPWLFDRSFKAASANGANQ